MHSATNLRGVTPKIGDSCTGMRIRRTKCLNLEYGLTLTVLIFIRHIVQEIVVSVDSVLNTKLDVDATRFRHVKCFQT